MPRLWTPGLFFSLWSQLRLAVRLFREPRVPGVIKTVPVLALLYALWPLDIVPDLFPVLGQLDDLGILVLGLQLFVRLSPPAAVAHHHAAIERRQRYSPLSPEDDYIDVG